MNAQRMNLLKSMVYAPVLIMVLVIAALLAEQPAMAADAAPGDLDPTFGNGGIVTTSFPAPIDAEARAGVLQADGKLVTAGKINQATSQTASNFMLARFLPDGSPDPSFGEEGTVVTSFYSEYILRSVANAVVYQPDGKIVAAGGEEGSFLLARYLPDGSLDSSFGGNGKVATSLGGAGAATDLVLQPDGKLITVGYFTNPTTNSNDFTLARYLPDGSLDNSFGAGGRVSTDFAGGADLASSVVLLADGRFVVAGTSGGNFALARYFSNGVLDITFGGIGHVTTDLGGESDYALDLALTQDGRIVAAGRTGTFSASSHFALVRYAANGGLDTTFGAGGIVTTSFDANHQMANAVLLLADGRIIAGGLAQGQSGSDMALARYLTNGNLDSSFGTGGKVVTNYGTYSRAAANDMLLQPDGKAVAAGYADGASAPSLSQIALARYEANGSLDPAFGSGGKVTRLLQTSFSSAYAMAIQSDGKIVAAGPGTTYCNIGCTAGLFMLARYLPDGSLDANFGSGGRVSTSFNYGGAEAYAIAIQTDGKIVVAGYAGFGTEGAFALARYMPDGSLDTTFDMDGTVVTNVNEFFRDAAFAVVIQPDGKIVAAGYSSTQVGVALVRYLPDGSLDTSFHFDGIVKTRIGNADAYAFALALQPGGRILVGGATENDCSPTCTPENFLLVSYLPNGELDTTFGAGGIVTTTLGSDRNARIHALKLQPDGKIVAGGMAGVDCNNSCSSSDYGLARYMPNGALDTTFGNGGIVTTDFNGFYEIAFGLALHPDGKITLVGSAGEGAPNYGKNFGLARYLENGDLDPGFGNGGKVETRIIYRGEAGFSEANGAAVDQEGRIVVAGAVRSTSGNRLFALARYLTSGAQCSLQFSDVLSDNPFYVWVRCLACRGIVSGYSDGTFRPNNEVTRGQLAKIVSNAAGFVEAPGPQIFEDVPATHTFYDWVNRLARRGHMSGYPCGGDGEPCGPASLPYFRPTANATRGQTSKIVSNAAVFNDTPPSQTFEDVPPSNPFYLWIERLAVRNIMGGYPCGGNGEPCGPDSKPYFRPGNNVTRGQSAKIVANTFYPSCDTP